MLKPVTHAKRCQLRQNHLSTQALRVLAVVLDEDLEHGAADLRVARLVGLDALHHLLEHPVARVARQRRERRRTAGS